MRRSIQAALLIGVLVASAPATVYAAGSPSPLATPSASSSTTPSTTPSVTLTPKSKPAKQGVTQAQKDAIAAARLAFSNAKINAQNGFSRALADAQAIRDQATLGAGKDKIALSAARKEYKASYLTILSAFKIDLKNAQATFQTAMAAAKLVH